MDQVAFDRLARAVSAGLSRRQGLRIAFAAIIGGAVALESPASGAARTVCRTDGASCSRNTQCCSGVCETSRTAPRRRRNRCACVPQCSGKECGPDACGGSCGVCEETDTSVCCGDSCKTLGSNSACSDCDDVCNTADWDVCLGVDEGCDHICTPFEGATGFVSVDDVPRYFTATNNSYYEFAEQNGRSWPQVINCTTSADCDAFTCPQTVDREGIIPTAGCGCIRAKCVGGVHEDHYEWHKPDNYHCAVMFDY